MKNNNKDDFIVISKSTLVNWFFCSVLIIGVVVFIVLFVKSAMLMGKTNNSEFDASLVTYYSDEFLNATYAIPGGTWGLGEIDTTGIEKTTQESSGEDNYFSLDDDILKEEVLSTILFNQEGAEGYRQFMSFTFKPNVEYTNDEFLEYCKDSFKRDIENSGDYDGLEFLSSVVDTDGGVLLKMTVNDITSQDSSVDTSNMKLYYTQYIKKLGKNLVTVTFGSIVEDNTVDIYLKYFLNNITLEKSSLT